MLLETIVVMLSVFILGYVLGRTNFLYRNIFPNSENAYLNKNNLRKHKTTKYISIDDSKFVTEVDTSSFLNSSKKNLGAETTTENTISTAVSKLKNLKNK